MYIGNDLVAEKNPPATVTDSIRAAKHGLDKWSFRRTSAIKPNS